MRDNSADHTSEVPKNKYSLMNSGVIYIKNY
jgi:hypothetical protein